MGSLLRPLGFTSVDGALAPVGGLGMLGKEACMQFRHAEIGVCFALARIAVHHGSVLPNLKGLRQKRRTASSQWS